MTTSKEVLDFLVDYCEQKHWPIETSDIYRSNVSLSYIDVDDGVWYNKINYIQMGERSPLATAALLTHEVGHCIDFTNQPFCPQPMAVYRHDNGTEYTIDSEVYKREQLAWVEGVTLLRQHKLFDGWFQAYTEAAMRYELSCYWGAYCVGVKILANGEHKGVLSDFKVNPDHKNYKAIAKR